MMFDKGAKLIQWGNNSVFNKWWWESAIYMQKNKTELLPYTIHKT